MLAMVPQPLVMAHCILYDGADGANIGYNADNRFDIRDSVAYLMQNGEWEYTFSTSFFAPYSNNVNALGQPNIRWTNVYSSGLDIAGNSSLGGDLTATGTLAVTGTGDSYIQGNVGIGTTSPEYLLDLYGSTAKIGLQDSDSGGEQWEIWADGSRSLLPA